MAKKNLKTFVGFDSFGWSKMTLVVVVLVLVGFGLIAKYNFYVAAAKARDWERKEQVKRTYNSLLKGYYENVGVFPPHSDEWKIRGCGDEICPTADNQGALCHWGPGLPAIDLRCGEDMKSYLVLSSVPDNPYTRTGDALRYKRIATKEVSVEACLELRSDPEAMPVEESLIGWSEEDCPSGGIIMWPEK